MSDASSASSRRSRASAAWPSSRTAPASTPDGSATSSSDATGLGPPILVAGQSLPTFGTRKVVTRLRLRDGESNLLAGLLSQEDRQILKGFPGLLRLPILRQLFSANDESAQSTDIVMLLTPRIVRTHGLTQEDVGPIHIGTRDNPGVTGPPPRIAPRPNAGP